jgi:hypothetical protein
MQGFADSLPDWYEGEPMVADQTCTTALLPLDGQHATEIRYDCATRWFAVRIDDAVVAFAPHYLAGERVRLTWLRVAARLRSGLDRERS